MKSPEGFNQHRQITDCQEMGGGKKESNHLMVSFWGNVATRKAVAATTL